jgi:hypothetical protein
MGIYVFRADVGGENETAESRTAIDEDGLIEYEQGMTTCIYFRINYIIQRNIEWFTLPIVDIPSIPRLTDHPSRQKYLGCRFASLSCIPACPMSLFCKFCSMKTSPATMVHSSKAWK